MTLFRTRLVYDQVSSLSGEVPVTGLSVSDDVKALVYLDVYNPSGLAFVQVMLGGQLILEVPPSLSQSRTIALPGGAYILAGGSEDAEITWQSSGMSISDAELWYAYIDKPGLFYN